MKFIIYNIKKIIELIIMSINIVPIEEVANKIESVQKLAGLFDVFNPKQKKVNHNPNSRESEFVVPKFSTLDENDIEKEKEGHLKIHQKQLDNIVKSLSDYSKNSAVYRELLKKKIEKENQINEINKTHELRQGLTIVENKLDGVKKNINSSGILINLYVNQIFMNHVHGREEQVKKFWEQSKSAIEDAKIDFSEFTKKLKEKLSESNISLDNFPFKDEILNETKQTKSQTIKIK